MPSGRAGDVLGANGVLMDAFATDVWPMLAELRSSQGLDPDPMAAHARSGYDERIVAERELGLEQAAYMIENVAASSRRILGVRVGVARKFTVNGGALLVPWPPRSGRCGSAEQRRPHRGSRASTPPARR